MPGDSIEPVEVTRRIQAPAHEIFQLLVTPVRHLDFDGSEMLRGADGGDGELRGIGDSFLMRMYYEQFGDYVMKNVVVEFEADRRIAWEPERYDVSDDEHWHHRWGYRLEAVGGGATDVTEFYDCSRAPQHARDIIKNGTVWTAAMTKTLERLDALGSTAT